MENQSWNIHSTIVFRIRVNVHCTVAEDSLTFEWNMAMIAASAAFARRCNDFISKSATLSIAHDGN